MNQKWLKITVAVVVLVLAVGLVTWNRFENWYNTSLMPVAAAGDNISFEVRSGESSDEIAKNLEEAGIIQSARAFNLYLGRTGQRSSLQAGIYSLNPAMSSQTVADIIINGKVDAQLLTITPGLRLDEIKQVLIEAGFEEQEINTAFKKKFTHPLLATKPSKSTLEGYIFPESIQINSETTVNEVLSQSFEIFWGEITDDMKAGIKKQGLSLHEAIIMASIIEKESEDTNDQAKMARVFYNRLAQDIPLGSDPTFKYAAAIRGVEPAVDIDSPYNTRIYKGLPPGPIANFKINALEAVAFPADGDWLYFVSGDDGITRFARTLEEHEQNVEKYCDELCQL